jgi:hypothetical protein
MYFYSIANPTTKSLLVCQFTARKLTLDLLQKAQKLSFEQEPRSAEAQRTYGM